MANYYEYKHREGYGSDDHMANEIIARAARQLGFEVDDQIAQCVGLANHSVPMTRFTVRSDDGPNVREKMERALRLAKNEVLRRNCCIEVVCCREIRQYDEIEEITRVRYEERRGNHWVLVSVI
jgi:hypothetical protein